MLLAGADTVADFSRRCPLASRYSAEAGVWRLTSLCTCLLVIHMRNTGKSYQAQDLPAEKLNSASDFQSPDLTLDRLHLRVDWQTLRRLPLSGAVVFNFKALFTPIAEFRDEPYIPSIILKVCKEGKENLLKYKNTWHTEHIAIPALEQFEKEQIEKGMIEKDWNVETLAEHPWYPTWEEKWHRRQGF